MPVIIDTTVWVDFFRAAETEQTMLLERIVRQGDAAVGDLIVGEILQGVATEEEFRLLKRRLASFPVYPLVGLENAVKSAQNYRKLRARGFTVRKTVDCWIATFCIEHGFPLLHNDRDFNPFEKHLGLKVVS